MRTEKAARNIITSIALQLTMAISGLLVPRFFIEAFGSSVNGLVSSITQFITYMSLVEAGVGAAGTVLLYRPLANDDRAMISRVVSTIRLFYFRSGGVFVGLLVALVLLYPHLVENEIGDYGFIRMMILVMASYSVIDYFFLGKNRVLLQADQKGYVISIVQIIGTILMTAVSILMIKTGASAVMVKLAAAVIYILRSIVVDIYVRFRYPDISFRAKPLENGLAQSWSALVHQIASMVVYNTDIVLLTICLTADALSEVSVYSIYAMVAYAVSSMLTSLSSGATPAFGEVIAKGERDTLRRTFREYECDSMIMIFSCYICMAVLMHPFIELYSSSFPDSDRYTRWPLTAFFVVNGLLQSLRMPAGTLINAAGHFRQTQWRAIAEALINLLLSLVLVFRLGIYGVLTGTLISNLYRTTDMILYSSKHILKEKNSISIIRIWKYTAVSILVTAAGFLLVPQEVNTWIGWSAEAIVTVILTTVLVTVAASIFDRTAVKATSERIIGMIKHISNGDIR